MSDQNRPMALVFFATAKSKNHWRPWTKAGYMETLSWLVRQWCRFPYAHCSIGFRCVVLDPHIRGNRLWPLSHYILRYPTLALAIKVPLTRPIDIKAYDTPALRRRKAIWPSLLRWWSGGRLPSNDCVATVTALLREGGLDVPRSVYRPDRLYRFLEQHDGATVTVIDPGAAVPA